MLFWGIKDSTCKEAIKKSKNFTQIITDVSEKSYKFRTKIKSMGQLCKIIDMA